MAILPPFNSTSPLAIILPSTEIGPLPIAIELGSQILFGKCCALFTVPDVLY